MFDSKRIKELETKVDLLLDYIGLEYQPRLVSKERLQNTYNTYAELDKDNLENGEDVEKTDLVAIKDKTTDKEINTEAIEALKEVCPFYHKEGKKENSAKDRVCKICGNPVMGKQQYCNKCLEQREKTQKLKWERKNRKKGTHSSRVCKRCGKRFSTDISSHRQYCNKCRKIKETENHKRSSKKYNEKKKALKLNNTQKNDNLY